MPFRLVRTDEQASARPLRVTCALSVRKSSLTVELRGIEPPRDTSGQRAQLRAVIAALELGDDDVYLAVADSTLDPPPTRDEVTQILHILESDAVQYRRGEPVEAVVGRIMDVIEDLREGRTVETYVPEDDRY